MSLTQVSWQTINTASVTATNIADKTASVNTTNKYEGLFIWDSTNHRLMRSEGSSDVSVWWVVDGSASVTPS
jgi:hypothetical protein